VEDNLLKDGFQGKLIWSGKGRTEPDDRHTMAMVAPGFSQAVLERTHDVEGSMLDGKITSWLK
jgi:hypothetical protein